jgi:hypothetical protein
MPPATPVFRTEKRRNAISERTARLARDKHAMRQAFAAGKVIQPAFDLARTGEEAAVVAGRVGSPPDHAWAEPLPYQRHAETR